VLGLKAAATGRRGGAGGPRGPDKGRAGDLGVRARR
jgi:hypothetical protein